MKSSRPLQGGHPGGFPGDLDYNRRFGAMKRLSRMQEKRTSASTSSPSERGRADLALVRRALGGQAEAERNLAERLRCLPRILRHLNGRLARPLSEADFQDLVQDTAFALWKKLAQFDGRGALETWAYRFCALQLYEQLRATQRGPRLVEDFQEIEETEEAVWTESRADPTVDVELAFTTLEPDEQEVVRMKHYDDATFEEIGRLTKVSANTAKTRYYRALLKLRDHLCGRYPELFGKNVS